MGMFDNIKCMPPLPDGTVGYWDQTKEFGCFMSDHAIDRHGQLWLGSDERVEVPKSERTFPNAPDDSFISLAGSLEVVAPTEKSDWTGGLWIKEYFAVILGGKLKGFYDPEGETWHEFTPQTEAAT